MSNGRLRLVWTLCATVLSAGATSAAADVSGKWRFTIGNQPPTIVDVTDSAGVVSFTLLGVPFSGPSLTTLSSPPSPPGLPCPSYTRGFLLAGERHLRSTLTTTINPPTCSGAPVVGPLYGDRCACFDGNAADGDGCSAACQIEACFTCAGMPSVCTPSANGAACDDGRDCTGGETCSAGVCSGGAALPSCSDISGTWRLHVFSEEYAIDYDETAVFTQRDGYIEVTGGGVGEIDTATGAFSYYYPPVQPYISSPVCAGPSVVGSVAADGLTLTGGRSEPSELPSCLGALLDVTGTRCGNGTVDSGEACDDGDADNGDGCSAACALEPCWSCSGDPSVCAPANGGACDPADACLSGGTCSGGACAGGTPVACAACQSCDPVAGCIAAPRLDCGSAGKASVVIKDSATPNDDLMTWRWVKGAATDVSAFGNPTQDTTYDVCVFDQSTTTPTLLFHTAVAPGSGWKSTAGGFAYRGGAVRKIALRSGAADKAKALFSLRGELPVAPLAVPLTVQLQGENAACFSTTFDAGDVQANAAGKFKARR